MTGRKKKEDRTHVLKTKQNKTTKTTWKITLNHSKQDSLIKKKDWNKKNKPTRKPKQQQKKSPSPDLPICEIFTCPSQVLPQFLKNKTH